jgi:hypothetical protein
MAIFCHFFDLGTNEAMTSFGRVGVFISFAPSGHSVHPFWLNRVERFFTLITDRMI